MAGANGGAVDINVGGVLYSSTVGTLTKRPDSRLGRIFGGGGSVAEETKLTHNGKVFIDRDGVLFRFVLDYLRNGKLVLPENFQEKERLRQEAEFYQLTDMVQCIDALSQPRRHTSLRSPRSPLSPAAAAALNSNGNPQGLPSAIGFSAQECGYITIGYRGTFAFGRDGAMADVKFRKLLRILVAGRVSLCKEVFGETLNESRDPDRGDTDRYTSRFFLKHPFLEQAFDMLLDSGFRMVGSCGAGTNSAGDVKPGMDSEECKWLHYNEFVFCRP